MIPCWYASFNFSKQVRCLLTERKPWRYVPSSKSTRVLNLQIVARSSLIKKHYKLLIIMDNNSRRDFIKKSLIASGTLSLGGVLPAFSAKSYNNIIGANERLNISMMGVNARGNALAQNFAAQPNSRVIHICDVASRAIDKCKKSITKFQEREAAGSSDFRRSLESKDVDILVVATPDHWHAPAAILASQAGKHVYLEKPCGHNPREGELLSA